MTAEANVRDAGAEDIPLLVRHRRLMKQEILELSGRPMTQSELDAIEAAFFAYLRQTLGRTTWGWVAELSGRAAASAVVSKLAYPPDYAGATGPAALLYNVYTELDCRRMGCARRVCEAAIAHCRAHGMCKVVLHTSDAGRPLYEALGFYARPAMWLDLPREQV